MSDTTSDMNKVDEYFELLEERLINPITNTDIVESCTATLVLLFAAIDSLSKITCCKKHYDLYKKKRGVRERFEGFLKLIGGDYGKYADKIYGLRNELLHTGIMAKVWMSESVTTKGKHLTERDCHLYINTRQFLQDFRCKKNEVRKDACPGGKYHSNAQTRLHKVVLVCFKDDEAEPTPAPDDEPYCK